MSGQRAVLLKIALLLMDKCCVLKIVDTERQVDSALKVSDFQYASSDTQMYFIFSIAPLG